MMNGVTYDREDTCPCCKRKRALELYDKNDKPGYFSMLLDKNLIDRLASRPFYYMKCTVCNKEFRIDWSQENRIPVPLLGNKLRYFLEDYNNSYEGIS